MIFYKPAVGYLEEHAVDPDKRRYAVKNEAPRHYIDLDHYGSFPYDSLPRSWAAALAKYGADTLQAYGIVPWWLQIMASRLRNAFLAKDRNRILRLSAELGHYIADAHVPLHATRNHNGQYTGQRGIHGFWESRIPELLAEKEWDFVIGKAAYLPNTSQYMWQRIMESGVAADSVLRLERELAASFPPDQRFAFEERNGVLLRQYSTAYTIAYDAVMKGMVERRMRQSVYAVACFWYTCWVNAGQPDLGKLLGERPDPVADEAFERLNQAWQSGGGGEH